MRLPRSVPFHILLLLTLGGCSASGPARDEPAWTFDARASYLYGPIRGHLQTPTGGNPGTTSPNRPTLKELGIDATSAADFSFTAGLDDHRFYAGYRVLRMSESATLDDALTSQGHDFPAGTRVSSDVTLDWLRVGYAHRFRFDLSNHNLPDLDVYPMVGASVLNFDYRLGQPGPEDAHRSYILPAPQVGLGVEWPLTRRFSLTATGLLSFDIGNSPVIDSVEIAGRYRVFERGRLQVDATLGGVYDRIRYNDNGKQTVPNDVDVTFGPAVMAGLSFRF